MFAQEKYKLIESAHQEQLDLLKKEMMTTQEKTSLTEVQIAVAETKGNRMEAEVGNLKEQLEKAQSRKGENSQAMAVS